MSWIVKKKNVFFKKNKFDEFILISTPKCGGMSLEKYLSNSGYSLSRPQKPNLTGHYTFLDTYSKIESSKYKYITKYLIPYRDSYEWRKSFYKYVKSKPNESGMTTISYLFNQITFSQYVELLISGKYNNFGTIENLAFIPRNNYISNVLNENLKIDDVEIYLYNMSNGFKNLFTNHFECNLDETEIVNSTEDIETYLISDELLSKLNKFDEIKSSKNIFEIF